jgi:alcohol dehydrogenase
MKTDILMNNITLLQPARIVFGKDSIVNLPEDELLVAAEKVLLLIAVPVLDLLKPVIQKLGKTGKITEVIPYSFPGEPTFVQFDQLLEKSEKFNPDCVIGVGGGSVLDSAKLLAAMTGNEQKYNEVVGVNMLKRRMKKLICVSTTSGTGSEVSPIAILLNEATDAKSGIVSPALLADVAYIDPALTVGLPPKFTAETGIDALCHCIEAYTNKFSHPAADTYALKGIELISKNLLQAYQDGNNINARSALSLGAMYGGLVLGPVNTHGVHCLSYGLGGKYHISHGLANAVLLPAILRYNLETLPEKHAEIALAMGIEPKATAYETALAGIEFIEQLSAKCGIPSNLSELGITENDLPELAQIAMNTTRLLKNCPRKMTKDDAMDIYRKLL